jgi:hypothetical protein
MLLAFYKPSYIPHFRDQVNSSATHFVLFIVNPPLTRYTAVDCFSHRLDCVTSSAVSTHGDISTEAIPTVVRCIKLGMWSKRYINRTFHYAYQAVYIHLKL